MPYGSSGQRGNIGPSERHKGRLTRCGQVLRLCYLTPQNRDRLAAELGMSKTKVSECLTLLRRRGLMQEGWGCCKLTDAGLVEASRLCPQASAG